MLKETKKFYKGTKLTRREFEEPEGKVPITFTKVFHKEYPRFPSIPLAETEEKGEFDTLLEIRKSQRYFSESPISFKELSRVLKSCRIVDNIRDPERRTYPSGGARFPIEPYVIAYNVEGLEAGAYHYSMKNSSLELLLKENLTKRRRMLISPYLENPAATLIFTSVISRSEVKYGLRAYPYSLIEAGHIGQNIQLKCCEIGLGSCPVSGFVDDEVIKVLDLTENEIPLYSISFGKVKV